MRNITLKLFTVILFFFPILANADEKFKEAFKANCVKAWMEIAAKNIDMVDYKNFGEKYCDCASSKKLDSQADLEKAAQICVSQILLHDTMDNLEDRVGLAKLSQEQILSGCQYKWKMLYPDRPSENYCQCAAPKLYEMNHNSENMTDKEWYEKMNAIADSCAGNVTPNKATTTVKAEESK